MSITKSIALALSGVALFTGVALEVDARIKEHSREKAADVAALEVYDAPHLAVGAPHCVTSNTLRLYVKAVVDNRVDFARGLVERGLCGVLEHPYEYEFVDQSNELVEVRVILDETEYQFWVEQETLQ